MHQCFFCNYFFKFVKRKKKKKKKINNQKILDERDTTDIEDICDIINVENGTYCSALYQGTDTTNIPKDEDIEDKYQDMDTCQKMDTNQITRDQNDNTVTYQYNNNENKDDSNSSTTCTYNNDKNNMKEIEIFNGYVDKICNSDKHKKNYNSILLSVYNNKGKKTHFNRNLLRRIRNNKHWNYSVDRQYLKFINYYRIKKIKKEIIRLTRFINLYLSLHYCKRAINSLICIKKYSNEDIMNNLIRIKKGRKTMRKKNNIKNIFFENINYSEINDTYNNIHMSHNFNGENIFSYFKKSSKFISAFNNLYMLFISEMCKIEHTKKYFYTNSRIDNNKNKLAYLYINFLKNCIKIITNLEIKKIKNRRQIQIEKNVSSHYSNINKYMKKEILKSKYIKSVIYICNTYLQNIENTHFYNITKLKEYYSFIKKCDININKNNCKVQCNKPFNERLYINNYRNNKKEYSNSDRIIYLYINGGVINIKKTHLKKCGLNCFIKLKGNKFAHLFLEKEKNNEIKYNKEKTKDCKEMEKLNDIYYMTDGLEIQHDENVDKINENMTSFGNIFRVNRKDTHKTTYISLSIQRDEQISNIKKIKEDKYIYKQRKYCNISGKNNNKNYSYIENGKSRKDKICKRILLTKSTKKYTCIKNKDNNTTRVKQIIKSYSKIYTPKKENDKINKSEQTINTLNDREQFCSININLKNVSKIEENFKGWNNQNSVITNERSCKETINSLNWDEFNEFEKNEKSQIFGNEDNFNNLNNEYNRYTNKNNYENNTINIFIDCLEKCEYIKNNFKFIELIKDNTINFLYKCYDIKNNKNVVIKCVNKEKQLSIMSYNTYTNIYKIIKKIDNENIIKIYDVLENQSHFFIIMELCEGTDLVDYVSNENISFEKIKDIIFQLLSGISALHDNFIIHRDIKLDNLMFKDKNFEKLVIIDFDMSIYICAKDQIYPCKADCIYTSETNDTIYDNKFDKNYMNVYNPDQIFGNKIGISDNLNTEFSEKSQNNICKEEHNAATSNTFTDYANHGKHENENKMENHDSVNIKNSCLYKNEPNMNTIDSNNIYTNKVTENDKKCNNFNSWHFSNSYDYIKNKTHNKKSTSLDYNYIRKIENNFLSTNTRDIEKPFINNEDKIIYNDLIIGTKEYMSPHCLKGMYSIKTDIYSVGVTIFLIIFKSFPYLFEEISIDKWEDEIINKNKEIVIPFSFLFHNVNCTYFIKLMDLHLINNNIYFCNDSCLLDDNLKEIAKIQGIKFDFDKIKINQKNIYLVEILRKTLSLDVCDQYNNVSQIMESSLFN